MKMAASIVLATLVLAGCGGGGGSDAPTGGSPGTLSATFIADQFSPSAGMVTMSQGSRAADSVTIKVNLTDTSSVFGVAFDVVFDETKVTYVGFTKGTALENNGNTPNYTVDGSAQPGRLVVGVSRAGSTSTSVSGTKPVISLSFRVKELGDFPISFENSVVTDAQTVPQPLPGITWFAGTLQGD
jgi:hypothetical protein